MNKLLIKAATIGAGTQDDPRRPDLGDLGYKCWGSVGETPAGEMLLIVETTASRTKVAALRGVQVQATLV